MSIIMDLDAYSSSGYKKYLITSGQTIFNIQPHILHITKHSRKLYRFTISVLSKRACEHVMKSKKHYSISKLQPKIVMGDTGIVICGFQPETGIHTAYYEPNRCVRQKFHVSVDSDNNYSCEWK